MLSALFRLSQCSDHSAKERIVHSFLCYQSWAVIQSRACCFELHTFVGRIGYPVLRSTPNDTGALHFPFAIGTNVSSPRLRLLRMLVGESALSTDVGSRIEFDESPSGKPLLFESMKNESFIFCALSDLENSRTHVILLMVHLESVP
jgi:hypothetical protein